ncbi:hypothetical protein LCGC14_2296470 [marine sediment metagenome]|uniref:Uncharacterized protein n=1 Tax=marine sediment metagenome TaxID=412755 RepID=A0A0F9FJV4_9ZZZZ
MSSKIEKKKYQEPKGLKDELFDVKIIILPFSLIHGTKEEFIYTGEEKIPFRKRHPIYVSIFLNEFSEYLKTRSGEKLEDE